MPSKSKPKSTQPKPTSERITLKGEKKARIIYVGPRGGKYVKKDGAFVSLKSMPMPKSGKKAQKRMQKGGVADEMIQLLDQTLKTRFIQVLKFKPRARQQDAKFFKTQQEVEEKIPHVLIPLKINIFSEFVVILAVEKIEMIKEPPGNVYMLICSSIRYDIEKLETSKELHIEDDFLHLTKIIQYIPKFPYNGNPVQPYIYVFQNEADLFDTVIQKYGTYLGITKNLSGRIVYAQSTFSEDILNVEIP